MRINQAGRDLIKSFESLELSAYPDPATGGEPWTIGWGHTGRDVKKGMTITLAQSESYLDEDVTEAENAVLAMVKVPLSENQFAALVSFVFNCGQERLRTSTLLKKLNAGDPTGAANEFDKWVYANKKKMKGLVRRRAAEKALFLQ